MTKEGSQGTIAAVDIARVIVKILENPDAFGSKVITVTGSREVGHIELAGILASTLGKQVRFEQVTPDEFVRILGWDGDPSFAMHFKAISRNNYWWASTTARLKLLVSR